MYSRQKIANLYYHRFLLPHNAGEKKNIETPENTNILCQKVERQLKKADYEGICNQSNAENLIYLIVKSSMQE